MTSVGGDSLDRSQRGVAVDLGKVGSMKAMGTDALNLIRHWKEERAQMHCTCASEGAGFQLTGRITELSDSVLSVTGTACEALIPLDGVSYHYHGSQDIPSAMKKSLEGTLVSVLELRLRSGDTVVMAEVRTASSPAERPQ
jgi:hypothetical protein